MFSQNPTKLKLKFKLSFAIFFETIKVKTVLDNFFVFQESILSKPTHCYMPTTPHYMGTKSSHKKADHYYC